MSSLIPSTKLKVITVSTFWAIIYVGFNERATGKNIGSMRKTRRICQKYTNAISTCVSVSAVSFHYYKGQEKGAKITFINYPRFPDRDFQIKIYARNLAEKLMIAFRQCRVSVVMPNETIMLTNLA